MRPTHAAPLCLRLMIGLLASSAAAQTVHTFPDSTEPLHRQVAVAERLIRGNHWKEGIRRQNDPTHLRCIARTDSHRKKGFDQARN